MLMGIKDFLAPTRGRILLFVIIFILVLLYDTMFMPFPGSPVVESLSTQEGATSFLLYILILPYILSCLLPAFGGLRKKRFWRLSRLNEFMHPRHSPKPQKPATQQHFMFPAGTQVQQSDTHRPETAEAAKPSKEGKEDTLKGTGKKEEPKKSKAKKPASKASAKPKAKKKK